MSKYTDFFSNRMQWIVYSLMLFVCFLLFKQGDLTHTYTSSYAYLNGHFGDFYDYNKVYLGGNDYLPLLYWIFAIWFIPLKILNLLPATLDASWQLTTVLEIIWAKLLLVIFFIGCLFQLRFITQIFGTTKTQGEEIVALFATSPFVVFAVFIFSQYDIISVYFVLLGLAAYFQKRLFIFIFWFSLAISLKYFALIIFVPLLLIMEKRVRYLMAEFLAALLPTIIQIALYSHSNVFLDEIFTLASGKAGDAMGRGIAFFLVGLYGLICLYAYFKKIEFERQNWFWYLLAIFSSLLAYDLMFSMVRWHPHWIVIATPFICLSYLFLTRKRMLITIELLAFLGFMVICVNTWERNADITMAYQGTLSHFLPSGHLIGRDLLSASWLPASRVFFYLYLYSPLVLLAVNSFSRGFKRKTFEFEQISCESDSSKISSGWFILRGIVSTTSFAALLLACIFLAPL